MQTDQQKARPATVVDAIRVMVGEQWLLLPMAAVAEVVRGAAVIYREVDNPWLHGWLQWRNTEIPLVAFEMLAGGDKARHSGIVNALVINTLGQQDKVHFYGLLIDDLPQPARITESSDFSQAIKPATTDYQLMSVVHEGQVAVIPDLQSLEAVVLAGL